MLLMFAKTSLLRQGAAAVPLMEESMPQSPIDPEARSRQGRTRHR